MPICATRPPGKHARHCSAVPELGRFRLVPQDGLRAPFEAVEPTLQGAAAGLALSASRPPIPSLPVQFKSPLGDAAVQRLRFVSVQAKDLDHQAADALVSPLE